MKSIKGILGVFLAVAIVVAAFALGGRFLPIGGTAVDEEISLAVIVETAGGVQISVTPKNAAGEPELRLTKGQVGAFEIITMAEGGFDARLHFEISGFPPGVATFSANDVAAGVPVSLRIDSGPLTTNTAYVVTLSVTDI
jgi:hypothetical protein